MSRRKPKIPLRLGGEGDNHNPRSLKTEFGDEWMNSEEAAAYLRLSPEALYNQVSQGLIPYYKLGSLNRFLRSELRQLILSQPKGLRNVY